MDILSSLTTKQRNRLINKSFNNNEIIFHELEECVSIGVIVKGQVIINSYLENGKEVIYNTLKENDIFGNNLIFSNDNRYKGNVISKGNSEIVFLNRDDLLNVLMNNKTFLIYYLNIQSNFSKTLNNNIKLLSLSSAEDRLFYYLHTNNNVIEYDSISSLSKTLFLERETLSRLISKLSKEKRITKDKKTLRKYNDIED